MMSFQRGFRSFRRNYARDLIVVFLLFVCLTFSMSMLAVKLAADSQVEQVKSTVGNYGEIKVSSKYQMEQFQAEREMTSAERQARARSMTAEEELENRTENLVPETLTDEFSKQDSVKTYDRVLDTNVTVSGLTNTSIQQLFQIREGRSQDGNAGPPGSQLNQNMFFFSGNTNGASASDFTTGARKLVDGELFTYGDYQDENAVVVIEKNLADDNGLEVGDTIKAQVRGQTGSNARMDLTVIGIYETVEAEDQGKSSGSSQEQGFNPVGSTFYAPVSVVQKLNGTPGYLSLGSYYFSSVDDTEELQAAFKQEAGSDSEKYELATDLSDYETIADPLLKAGKTSVIGLAGALGACAVIILLAMVIIVSGRTRELGVLKAIGSTDRQVITQFAFEVLCICLVAVILAMGVTAVIGQRMGNWLLPKTEAATTAQEQEGGPMGGPGMRMMGGDSLYKEGSRFSFNTADSSEPAAKINVVYRGSLFLYGILILVGLSLVGMAIPVAWIIRLRPARVLSME